MNLFPVLGRELQISARKPLTHRLRVVIVFVCLAFCGRTLFPSSRMGNMGAGQGINLFLTLTVIAVLFSAFAGVFVCSDSLSREKRDGTLELLFLTNLRPIDVVFGKLFAHGLNLFYGLLAFVPILAMTLQMGGVSLALVGKTVLVLLNCLFLSIAVGIFVSSISKDERKALWASIGLLFIIYVGPYILIEYASQNLEWGFEASARLLSFISPLTAMNLILDGGFNRLPTSGLRGLNAGGMGFYIALLVPHLLGWFLLYRSGRSIARLASDSPRSTWFDAIRERWHYFLFGRGEQRRVHRQWLLDHHPMTWMVMREKLKLKYVWTFVVSVLFIWVMGYMFNGEIMAEPTLLISLGTFVHFFLKIWVASEAASAIAEDRRTGALELVVTTPLGAHGIVHGIFKASLLQFWKPVLLLVVAEVLLVCTIVAPGHDQDMSLLRFQYLAAIGMLVVDMVSIGWVAIWHALKTGSSHKAIGRSVVWMLALPWVIYFFGFQTWDMVWKPAVSHINYWLHDVVSPTQDQRNDIKFLHQSGHIVFWCLIGLAWNFWYAWRRTRRRVLSRFQTMVSESSLEGKS
ncbi:MAG: ABC transporter permease subunit [Verrucomicrobia bacterium]|mgnify:FL=1|jgi:ABC-type transport system involved in cytochrome c biogenesis permease component|nr:ABC transporter permease subunit [Verrucomicrobiota bacterium]MBT5478118.1 ABC transporter permease subunit [Verrucomicrobiota bacterium]MBT6240137.1 ABC transporter permease subunit [Verrucomicrobiota bacterium]MBT6805873.1 ABC transporter permease subunit [Verrucomicrobiota bacterium]MBT7876252.1 ABC transporter permease subunit [Verrucomicrobiota bacterium]